MAEYTLRKSYLNHYGLDLKSDDLTRPIEYASDMMNAQYRKSGAIEKRKGYQGHAASEGGHGLFTYAKVNPTTGIEEPEVLAVGDSLFKLDETTMTVTYTGSEFDCTISIFFDTNTSQYRCQIQEAGVQLLDTPLGIGFDESSPVTVSTLSSAINALTDFTSSVSGDGSAPAAFLKTTRDYDLSSSGGALAAVAGYWTEVNETISTPLGGSETNKNDTDFENVSAVQINNVMYFTNGYDEVHKYDGQTIYRAGIPQPASVASALGGAGAITGTNYVHVVRYVQKDAVGNFIEGNTRSTSPALSPTSEEMDVTIANIVAGSGFNTNGAIVAGAQVTVTTITVDDGAGGSHTMKVGDTAYFFDGVSSLYVEREITAISATSITIAGAAVTVADNAVISNNLRIEVYRNATSGSTPTTFFLLAEIPNDSFNATQVYTDNTTDANLGAQFVEPLTDRSPPPKGKYISVFRNQMVIAGQITSPNTVYYSDVDGPEYFPAGTNSFLVETISGDNIRGIGPNNEVFAVFKDKSIHIVSGNIADGTIRIDQLTSDIGCVAHATIKEVRGSLYFLSDRGPYSITGGQIPQSLGNGRIEPIFDQLGLSSTKVFQKRRAIAINDRDNERYILFLPAESLSGSNRYANSDSPVYAYDYYRDAWLKWNNMNMAGGVAINGDEMYFSERKLSSFTSNVEHILHRRHNNNDAYDYQDNNQAISLEYKSQWEALGEPSVLKRFIRLRVFSLEALQNNDLNIGVDTEINYLQGGIKSQLLFNFPSSGYGVSPYGVSPYGNPIEGAIKKKVINGRVRSIRLIFNNSNDQENMILSGWELECATPYRLRFKN